MGFNLEDRHPPLEVLEWEGTVRDVVRTSCAVCMLPGLSTEERAEYADALNRSARLALGISFGGYERPRATEILKAVWEVSKVVTSNELALLTQLVKAKGIQQILKDLGWEGEPLQSMYGPKLLLRRAWPAIARSTKPLEGGGT